MIKKSNRQGIPHLDNEKYGLKVLEFLDVMKYIEENSCSIAPQSGNFTIIEKSDGFSLRFGMDEQNKLFIESSHSGPVFKVGAFSLFSEEKHGTANDVSKGYDNILATFKNIVPINNILKTHNTSNGIKIHGEAYYVPNGTLSEDGDRVTFIATEYDRSKIGDWGSFVLFEVTDGEGNIHPQSEKIIDTLKSISSDYIKFDDNLVRGSKSVNLKTEINRLKSTVDNIEQREQRSITEILSDRSLKRAAVTKRREIKAEIFSHQVSVANKIRHTFTKGKWGAQMEGIIIKPKHGTTFKVVTDDFKKGKAVFNKQMEARK